LTILSSNVLAYLVNEPYSLEYHITQILEVFEHI
jgi:hypothetical protein